MQNFSYENEFDLHENGRAGEIHFHKNSFARRLVLTQRQTRTRKWAIIIFSVAELTYFCSKLQVSSEKADEPRQV